MFLLEKDGGQQHWLVRMGLVQTSGGFGLGCSFIPKLGATPWPGWLPVGEMVQAGGCGRKVGVGVALSLLLPLINVRMLFCSC